MLTNHQVPHHERCLTRRDLLAKEIDLLIQQARKREGALPLLQFALTQIWDGMAQGQQPAETLRAIGGVGGSWLIPALTAGKVSLRDYIGYFGLIVLLLGVMLIRETLPSGMAKKKKAKEAAAAFEKQVKAGGATNEGVKVLEGSWTVMFIALALVVASALWANLASGMKMVAYGLAIAGWIVTFFAGTIRFTFYGVEFSFKAFIPMLGGIFIAALASFLGIGGGFLFVPFLTSVAGLPMFLVAGTSALVVLVGMIVSIFSYMVGKGVLVY